MNKKLIILILIFIFITSLAFTLDVNPIDKINEVRSSYGINQLVHDPLLDGFAEYRINQFTCEDSCNMFASTYRHPNFITNAREYFKGRIPLTAYYMNEIALITDMQLSYSQCIDLWLSSPAHKAAMLSGNYTNMGYFVSVKFGFDIIFIEFLGKVN